MVMLMKIMLFPKQSIHFHAKSWLQARSIVMECLSARNDIDSSGEVIVLTRSYPVSEQWMFYLIFYHLLVYISRKMLIIENHMHIIIYL